MSSAVVNTLIVIPPLSGAQTVFTLKVTVDSKSYDSAVLSGHPTAIDASYAIVKVVAQLAIPGLSCSTGGEATPGGSSVIVNFPAGTSSSISCSGFYVPGKQQYDGQGNFISTSTSTITTGQSIPVVYINNFWL